MPLRARSSRKKEVQNLSKEVIFSHRFNLRQQGKRLALGQHGQTPHATASWRSMSSNFEVQTGLAMENAGTPSKK